MHLIFKTTIYTRHLLWYLFLWFKTVIIVWSKFHYLLENKRLKNVSIVIHLNLYQTRFTNHFYRDTGKFFFLFLKYLLRWNGDRIW